MPALYIPYDERMKITSLILKTRKKSFSIDLVINSARLAKINVDLMLDYEIQL